MQDFFTSGTKKGITAAHAERLRVRLTALSAATYEAGMSVPGWDLHQLAGKNPKNQIVERHWSVKVSGNWRLTFYFEDGDAVLVDGMGSLRKRHA